MFVPADRPRIAAGTGGLVSIHEAAGITIVALPRGAIARLDVDPEAEAVEVGWLGDPARLLVLSRYATRTTAQLFDPIALRAVAELALEARLRLRAVAGAHALVAGSRGAAIVTAGRAGLTARELPGAGPPLAAGAASTQLVLAAGVAGVAAGSTLELWDPDLRIRRRRLVLPVEVTRLGGNDRWLWLTSQQHPARIDLVAVVEPSEPVRPIAIELPEPIEHAAGHPLADFVACVGADTGRLYVVPLVAGARPCLIATPGIDRVEAAAVVVGDRAGVMIAQGQRPLTVVGVVGRELDPPAAAPAHRGDLVWQGEAGPDTQSSRAAATAWRDEAVAWAHAVEHDVPALAAPAAPPIRAILTRLGLPVDLLPALVLLYGAHLGGTDGASPRAVASVLAGSWAEALGRGQLAAHALARYADSRVRIADGIARQLDDA